MQQKKERVRIFALARELNMETKDLLVLCQEHGLDIRNQLSTIEPEQRDQILDLVKRGSAQTPSQAAPAPAPVVATPTRTIVNLDQRKPAPAKASPAAKPEPARFFSYSLCVASNCCPICLVMKSLNGFM